MGMIWVLVKLHACYLNRNVLASTGGPLSQLGSIDVDQPSGFGAYEKQESEREVVSDAR
jgi:hypothetical protein